MNYKETILLPKTDFPMKADLVRREPEFLARWEADRLYEKIQDARKDAPTFILHDGPPFANGDVHMGTALNKILKDIIVKHKAMTGHRAPYVPGWDCHGLPIEYKVVKSDKNLSPLQVRQKSEEFARKYIDIQRKQFKRLGVLGDWDHPYLTLDKKYEADVLRIVAEMVGQGLVYRSQKPVYWSTGAQTALAEAEVEYADKSSPAIFVKFEVVGMNPLTHGVIWTTTPWTLPANLAVAIHPRLPYAIYTVGSDRVILCDSLPQATYAKLNATKIPGSELKADALLSLKLKHPFLNREVPILAADFVASDTGTGCVHIAPGHGQDDYNVGKHLGLLSPVDDQGKFTQDVGISEWVGKYVFDANKDVIDLLRTRGVLVAEETIQHSYPHCWRSKTPIVFRAVDQWFIRIDGLRPKALQAVDSVQWVPDWGRNRIRGTLESRGDWCISRQRSWGVPLPILYKPDGEAILDKQLILKIADLVEQRGTNVWFELTDAELAKELGLPAGTTKRKDTLDVWIDSGSSHEAVLKRNASLSFPADLYLEGSDQHRGWFQSSLLTSVAKNEGRAPYKTVITNGFLVDLDGKKISKSSTYEKPKDAEAFVNKYGADIVRLWVASENYQNDVPLSEEIFTRIGDTYRSLRNAWRILLANLHDFDVSRHKVDLLKETTSGSEEGKWLGVDLWILSKLRRVIQEVHDAYNAYEFHKVYHTLNSFCAVELSAWYIDITKDRMYCDESNSLRRRGTQTAMHEIASVLARLAAPILSFTAEEAWSFLHPNGSSVHLQRMPDPATWAYGTLSAPAQALVSAFDLFAAERPRASEALERARQEKKIGKSIDAAIRLPIGNPITRETMLAHPGQLAEFFIVSQIEVIEGEGSVEVIAPRGKKCARSWKWDTSVGSDPEYPDVTARDARAIRDHLKRSQNVPLPT